MVIGDKSGGGLLQAELEESLGGSSPPMLVADNGRKSFEIDKAHAQFYRIISATRKELEALKKAGYKMDVSEEFQAREA